MNSFLGKLNLRPHERRLVVLVAIVVFVVLNIWLVWPHFGDLGATQMKYERAKRTLASYQTEIAKTKAYQIKLRELESAGSSVVPEEQELDLVRKVDNQAQLNRLTVIQSDPRPRVSNTQTNQFFEEQYETIHVTCGTEELVNFLVSLTTTNSLVRVKDLTLRLSDASGTKLDGQMTLVASYQRKTPISASAARPVVTNVAAAPAVKPAVNAATTKTNRANAALIPPGQTNKAGIAKPRMTNQPAKK